MYTLPVPPFVKVTVATTNEEVELLRHRHAFVQATAGWYISKQYRRCSQAVEPAGRVARHAKPFATISST